MVSHIEDYCWTQTYTDITPSEYKVVACLITRPPGKSPRSFLDGRLVLCDRKAEEKYLTFHFGGYVGQYTSFESKSYTPQDNLYIDETPESAKGLKVKKLLVWDKKAHPPPLTPDSCVKTDFRVAILTLDNDSILELRYDSVKWQTA